MDNCTWWIRSRKTDRRAREHFYCPQSSRPSPDNVWNKQTVHKRRWVPKVLEKRFYWCQKSVIQSLTIPCLWPAFKLFCTLWTSAEQESTTATPSNSMNWCHLKAVTASALENKFRNESSVLWSWHVVFLAAAASQIPPRQQCSWLLASPACLSVGETSSTLEKPQKSRHGGIVKKT